MAMIPERQKALSVGSAADTLKVLVTCTMDSTREKALQACLNSLEIEHKRCGFAKNLIVVDNNSKINEPLLKFGIDCPKLTFSQNIGYWGAVLWALENCESIFGRSFEFVHPVESDLVFYKTERLECAVNYLKNSTNVNTVRTQEFSVRYRHRFFKGNRSLFAKNRSRVAPYNGVTGEKLRLIQSSVDGKVWETNWHPKMPALHRFDALKSCLNRLKLCGPFTELDFMRIMSSGTDRVAVLDGGIYYSLLAAPRKGEVTGSYSPPSDLEKYGYRTTREDIIDHMPVLTREL